MPKLSFVSIKPTTKHTASVIFLHGLGDSGHGWREVGQLLGPALPHIKWIFPHSPERSITVNGGARMPGWYDIISLERIVGQEDEVGMLESKSLIQELIDAELDLGIPNTRIIVGGFSQGAAMSLLTGLGSKIKLGGLAVLSGYLPLGPKLASWQESANKETPIFMAHGSADPVVLYSNGKDSADRLIKSGYQVDFKTYSGMGHSSCNEELSDLVSFLKNRLQ